MVVGPWVLVSGTTGYDYASHTLPDDLVDQTRNTLENIRKALSQAGCSWDHVVGVHSIVRPEQDFSRCWPLLREAFALPAASQWYAALADPRMKVEIEVTAWKA